MTPEELQEARINLDCFGDCQHSDEICDIAEMCPKMLEHIDSLQAEIRKKDQEIGMWIGKHSYALDLIAKGDSLYRETCAAKDARIKDLEQQLAGQQAYIGRLETAFLSSASSNWECVLPQWECERMARGALEKLKTG